MVLRSGVALPSANSSSCACSSVDCQARGESPIQRPPFWREQNAVVRKVWRHLLLPPLTGTVAQLLVLDCRDHLLATVNTSSKIIPDLDEKTRVVRFVLDRDGMMHVVLVAGVKDAVVMWKALQLVAGMEVHPICPNHETEDKVHHVQVQWHADDTIRDRIHDDHIQRAHEVVHGPISNGAEGRGVVVLVVVPVYCPKALHIVPKVVPSPLV
mmetsp:Transcript_11485/g.22167  ORF Transcript_11485/g.22167 Transcript_11485/m.22167 type:complete len:212 (-) Transcript_11485:444-1079(-)